VGNSSIVGLWRRYSHILSLVTMPSNIVDAIAVYTGCGARIVDAGAGLVAALKVHVFDVKGYLEQRKSND
jgi:hypothetical protein